MPLWFFWYYKLHINRILLVIFLTTNIWFLLYFLHPSPKLKKPVWCTKALVMHMIHEKARTQGSIVRSPEKKHKLESRIISYYIWIYTFVGKNHRMIISHGSTTTVSTVRVLSMINSISHSSIVTVSTIRVLSIISSILGHRWNAKIRLISFMEF